MPGGKPTDKPMARTHVFPAPLLGWVTDQNLAAPSPMTARVLDNWAVTTDGIRARRGSTKFATLDSSVRSLFRYKSGTAENFFGATATAVYDITSPADPDVVPTAAISGQNSGYYSTEQFATAGGEFLMIVNGADNAQVFDGTSWAASGVTGVAGSDLSHVWSFGSRLWFVEKDTMNAHYLPVDSIAGALAQFSLAGIFRSGGSLLFGAKWSLDAGDGLDDKCVFVSTEGEVAVYEGTDPASASTWRKAGVYQISKPLGKRAIVQDGGDLLIATESGLVPMSAVIRKDRGDLDQVAFSRNITTYWQRQAAALSEPWDIVRWPETNQIIVSQPEASTTSCLVVNAQSVAWSRYTGWDTRCLGYFAEGGYFGSDDSAVYSMETGGSDNGTTYPAIYIGAHETLGFDGIQKTAEQARVTISSTSDVAPLVAAKVDFDTTPSGAPNVTMPDGESTWDSAIWDTAVWGGTDETIRVKDWVSLGRTGFVVAPEVQVSFGSAQEVSVKLISTTMTYSIGGVVN